MTDSSSISSHQAVEHEDIDELLRLLQQGADPNERDVHGMPLLHHAIDVEIDGATQTGSSPTIGVTRVLIQAGANPFQRWRGIDAFDEALERGHTEAAERLSMHIKGTRTGQTITNALAASLDGDIFPNWEFHTLMGSSSETARMVSESWPYPPVSRSAWAESALTERDLIVNNVLNMLLGYPHGFHGDRFTRRIGNSEHEVAAAFAQWRDDESLEGDGADFFKRMQ